MSASVIALEIVERYLRAIEYPHFEAGRARLLSEPSRRDVEALTLCAAAEENIKGARRLVGMPACFALQRVGENLLNRAGIDPERWEAAR